ncbi:MAG: FAD-binding oxidoreductase, partial [Thermoplasmata archaeon]|nr:FAD-binding oxidoreductase [Thermoplasmata archaeon]
VDLDAGVSLDSLIRATLPHGHFLSVTPGTRFVTIGGAIAADVHGKNHHRVGSFSSQVIDFDLVTAEGESLRCSREQNSEAFWATVGGMGLTGFVVRARLKLRSVGSNFVLVRYERAASLRETLDGLARGDREFEYTLAWLDLAAPGPRVGRSLLMLGRHAAASELPTRWEPFAPPSSLRFSVPFPIPAAPRGPGMIGAFNALYLAIHRPGSEEFVEFGRFFHPLDTVGEWNRLFGRRGFIECQFVVPNEVAEEVLTRAARAIRAVRRAPLLGVLKRFGDPSGGMLSFPRPGTTASLDLPVDDRLPGIVRALEEILLQHGGRVYLAKDAVQSPRLFLAAYPRLEEFRRIQRRLDPQRRLSTSMARRLGILGR